MALLPTNELLVEIRRAEKEVGMVSPKAVAVAIGAFEAGEFQLDTVDAWAELQRDKRPKLWQATDTEQESEAATEEHVAKFQTLKGQGELIAQYGEAKTKEIGKAIGAEIGKLGSTVKPKAESNPWKMDPSPEAHALIAGFIGRRGTKLAAEFAKAAGKKLDGSPLKGT